MKEQILDSISMMDIINKYGISHRRRTMRCPFHGQDKHPSAQIYDDGFHCFTCGKHLDVIGFVEEYFNLNFKEAMQKINLDFSLGLNSYSKINYKKIQQIQDKRKDDEKIFNKLQKKFCDLCDLKFNYLKKIKDIKSHITIENWELLTQIQSTFEDKIELIEIQLDFLIDEMYEFRRTRV